MADSEQRPTEWLIHVVGGADLINHKNCCTRLRCTAHAQNVRGKRCGSKWNNSERSEEVYIGAQPRSYGFGLYLSRAPKSSFLLVRVSWAPLLSLTLADTDVYLQQNTECLQALRFRGFTHIMSCLKDRVGLNLRPCSWLWGAVCVNIKIHVAFIPTVGIPS